MEALTLPELEQEANKILERCGLVGVQGDGRVSDTPGERTIRYYTSLGLLDRPRMVGREARYGKRHVLQLVAIKALQAGSLPLARIQEQLYGLTDAELEALLAAAADSRKRRPPEVREVRWREVFIEPGLKLMVQDGWFPRDPAGLEEKIRLSLNALKNGGSR